MVGKVRKSFQTLMESRSINKRTQSYRRRKCRRHVAWYILIVYVHGQLLGMRRCQLPGPLSGLHLNTADKKLLHRGFGYCPTPPQPVTLIRRTSSTTSPKEKSYG